jgi:cytochrome c biogenesis protein CcmG, thiol:disulfide interchange protein DsbE
MRLRLLAWAVGTGLAALLIAALGWGLLRSANQSDTTLVGRSMPNLTITILDGGLLDLASLRGTPLVLNFWASWCVPCKQEAPVLNAGAREYARRVQFVGVDIQDSDSSARSYQSEVMSPYPVGPSIKGSYLDWGVTKPPETFFVDRRGVVISRILGPVDPQRLEVYISQLAP